MKTTLLLIALLATGPAWAKDIAPSSDGDLELAHRLENAFVKVAAQASESVVVITSTRKPDVSADADEEGDPMERFKGTPFEYFFKHHRSPMPDLEDQKSEGSGVIIRADGYILTNNHVVDGADDVHVRLKDGREFDAKVIGNDSRTDVAVVKVDGKNLPAARLGDSDKIRVGQWALAIGTPFELDYSFTVGFVSAKGRPPMDNRTVATIDYIQTDAAINPGNSGGPLCDIEGRVVGINTLIRGLNRGIGFAIPINVAMDSASQIIASGRVIRPWLGIGIESLADNKELSDIVKEGVVVREIRPGTPASKSDLKQADIIVSVDGTPVKTPRELQVQVLRKKVGDTVMLDVVRGSKIIKVPVKTGEMNDEVHRASNKDSGKAKVERAFGLTVQTLNADLAKQLDVGESEGVVITEVADGSIAEQKGLVRADVVTEVDRAPVHSADEFKAAVAKADTKKGVLLFVKRNGASTFVVLKDSK
jgi:Do/DeqQ family serine protease